MAALDFHHLRNPRVIKAGVITLAAVGISVGVGVGVSNHRRGNKDVDAGTAGGDLPNEFTNEFEVLQADHLDEVEESPEYVPSAPLAPLTDEAAEKLRYYDATGGAGASGGYSDYPAYPDDDDDDDDNGADVVDGKHSLDGKDDDGWKGGSFHDGWHGGTSHDAWDGGWNDDGNVKWEKCWYPIDGSVPQGKSGKTKGGKYQSSTYYGGKTGKTKGGYQSSNYYGGKTGKTKGGYQSSTYFGGKSGKSGAGPYYGSSSGGKTNGGGYAADDGWHADDWVPAFSWDDDGWLPPVPGVWEKPLRPGGVSTSAVSTKAGKTKGRRMLEDWDDAWRVPHTPHAWVVDDDGSWTPPSKGGCYCPTPSYGKSGKTKGGSIYGGSNAKGGKTKGNGNFSNFGKPKAGKTKGSGVSSDPFAGEVYYASSSKGGKTKARALKAGDRELGCICDDDDWSPAPPTWGPPGTDDWKPPHDDGIHDNDDDGSWGPGWGWYWCTEKTHKPTDKPTTKPTLPAIKTTNPTPQPTHCEERRFYFHYDKCTNEYQRGWTVAGHSGYESLVACCWLNDDHFRDLEHCKEKSTDTCNPYVPSPTKKPTHTPTKIPAITTQKPTRAPVTPRPTECAERRFYFKYGICNNEYQLHGDGHSGYDNLNHCCMMNDDRFSSMSECKKAANDICNEPQPIPPPPTRAPVTPSPTKCGFRDFYYVFGTCTNKVQSKFSQGYDSLEKCCWFNNKRPPYVAADNLDYDGMDVCNIDDICNPRPPTRNPTRNPTRHPVEDIETPVPTPFPSTPEPTDETPLPTPFPSTPEPTEPIETPDPTPFPSTPEPTEPEVTPAPTPCEGRKWYLLSTNSVKKMCSNGYDIPPGVVFTFYGSEKECCSSEFSSNEKCIVRDVCRPDVLVTPVPTLQPTEEILTPVPTFIPTEEPTTKLPTLSPTFGSTPTVSKEISGPPTVVPDRNAAEPEGKTYVTTECNEEERDGECVYVCTDTISVVKDGAIVYQQDETYDEQCPTRK